ncbi:AhpC/TSA family protein [Chitinophaga horti]|uniref:AhpC/TSA family protein n=1 Tax=Chitinophaga horti TaxID=2920382 RepID=A0ABY6J6S2_9BACT|nr:AhpC/TSA family protein [Chitinophaga horti]UYQ95388.1 AhpC/TSA family protein [Chitinophaga horti]
MKRQTFALGLLLISGTALAQGVKTVVISGKFNGDTRGHNKVFIYGTGVKQDSAVMTDGNFTFTLPYEKPFMPMFYTEYDKAVKRMYQPFPLLIDEPGTVTLSEGDITKGLASMKVGGLKTPTAYGELRRRQNEMYAEVNRGISAKYGADWYKQGPQNAEARKAQSEEIERRSALLVGTFIKEHPDSYASVYALTGIKSSVPPAEVEKMYALLSPNLRKTEEAKSIAGFLTGLKKSAIGSKVDNFTLNNELDKPFSFASLKGKYVVIDFWASWCGPCKQSFPHMKEVYAKYKGEKFEIYSISIDKDKSAWLQGLKDQQLPWLQTLDTKGISSSGFAVTGVPTTFLVDPNGKILLKEVGFDPGGNSPLEKKLEELFGKGNN